jgi:hypothetical protein
MNAKRQEVVEPREISELLCCNDLIKRINLNNPIVIFF